MSIRFARSSEVIERLKYVRGVLNLTSANFSIWGAAEYEAASKTSDFMGNKEAILCVMIGNSSSNTLHEQAGGESLCSHNIDVVLFRRVDDIRGQSSDERSVWFKEFVIRALQGFEPWTNAPLLFFSGDQFRELRNVAAYARVFTFSQSVYIEREDIEGDGDFDDLDDFLKLYTDMETQAPPFDDVSDKSSLDITLSE